MRNEPLRPHAPLPHVAGFGVAAVAVLDEPAQPQTHELGAQAHAILVEQSRSLCDIGALRIPRRYRIDRRRRRAPRHTAGTPGSRARIFSGSARMQPVTMSRPFSDSELPIASSDSVCAISRNSAPRCSRASSKPSARSRVRVRSELTGALGQPSETKKIFAAAWAMAPATFGAE